MTADDFRYAWLRAIRPESASSNASSFFTIKGAKAFNRGDTADPRTVGISTPTADTLKITLETRSPEFLEYLSQVQFAPIPADVVAAHGRRWLRPEHIVTNGPYSLTELTHRVRIVLERNRAYWQREKISIPRILVHLGGDRSAGITRYKQNEQHVVMDVSNHLIPSLLKEKRPDFFIDDSVCYVDFIFNVQRAPFDTLEIRQAIAQAIDKERYVELLLDGKQSIADGPVPTLFTHSHNFPKRPGFGYDPERARNLLADAGYPNAAGLPAITLLHNPSENQVRSATFVQATLRENLNLKINLKQMEHKSLLARLQNHNFQHRRQRTSHFY